MIKDEDCTYKNLFYMIDKIKKENKVLFYITFFLVKK